MFLTTNTKTENVYQKLLKARALFLNSAVTKSGKNMHLAFKYFELDDIVPIATKIFGEVGIIPLVSFIDDLARMTIVNIDNPEECVMFTAPMIQLSENKGTNAVQAFGATVTYYRRYLYMIALDICEPDEIDSGIKGSAPTVTPTPVATPVATPTPVTPAPTEKSLTNADGNASEIQIKQLKDVLKKLRESDPAHDETISEIALKTKGFTEISKADCEELTVWASEILKGVN